MNQYIINHSIGGYISTSIDDKSIIGSDIVILVLDESTNDNLHKYYNTVIDIITSGTKLYCISIGRESKIRKAIMMLMTTYKNYNIYRVDSIATVDYEYINAIISREPDIIEVQQYIGGDVAAYSELNTVLLGITSLVNSGDLDGLKVFIENHLESIESSNEVFEYLRKMADNANSGELLSIVNNLKEQAAKLNKEIGNLNTEIKESRYENSRLNDKVASLTKDLQAANRKVASLEEESNNNSGSNVITSYKELNTSLIRCKTQYVIYFKELSYVRYMNSFVMNIFEFLKKMYKDRVKLLIYDNHVGIPSMYKGISVYNTNTYLQNRAKIVRSTSKLVVSEPNQVFLEDVLTSMSPVYDIVIVYDRMKQSADLVSGNNVTKFFVVNSLSNYNAAKEYIRIPPNATIVSGDPGIQGSIQIPEIPEYVGSTESAKLNKYTKLRAPGSNNMIMWDLLAKARINLNGGM